MVSLPNCGERSSRSMVWYAAPYLDKWVGKMAFSLSTRASHRGVVPGILISIRQVSCGSSCSPAEPEDRSKSSMRHRMPESNVTRSSG